LHGELVGSSAQLRADVLAMMAALGTERLWLEKLRVATRPPRQATGVKDGDDLAALLAEAAADPEFVQDLQRGLQPLLDKSPHELAEQVPAFGALRKAELTDLLTDAIAAVQMRLEKEI